MRDHHVVLVTTAPTVHESTRAAATRLAARSNAVLLFLHVTPLQAADGEGMLHTAVDLRATKATSWLQSQRPSDDSVRFRHRSEIGEPEAIVAAFVNTHEVDLIVVEEPPRTWMSVALWRGLAERLVRSVDVPVLIAGPHVLARPADPPVEPTPWNAAPAELLETMVDARAEALGAWMDARAQRVLHAARSELVRDAVRDGHCRRGLLEADRMARLRVELDEHRRAQRALGWQLHAGDRVWHSHEFKAKPGRGLTEFLQRLREHGSSTSLPVSLDADLERLAILSAARVDTDAGEGLLLFAFDAEDDFLRILGQPGPLPSLETYAFDAGGLMLSHSRFPEHLLGAGLLPDDGLQTPLRLRVAEPSEAPPEDWPLTRMVREAIRHGDGHDSDGYLDYRGTPVVGAWRWLARYGFGIVAELDRSAARAAQR